MEIVGGGGAFAASPPASTTSTSSSDHATVSPSGGTGFVGGLAQALGVGGFDGHQGRPLLDPRDALGSAMASRHAAGVPPSTPPPASSPPPPSPPPDRGGKGNNGGGGDVRAKYMEKLKARTAGRSAAGAGAGAGAGEDDEAARRTRARRLVEATERRGEQTKMITAM